MEIGFSETGAGSKNVPQVPRFRCLWKNHLEKDGSVSPAIGEAGMVMLKS